MKITLHLVSDSIGTAVSDVVKGCKAQFASVEFQEQRWLMVRSDKELEELIVILRDQPGVVITSIVNKEHQKRLKEACIREDLPCVSVIEDTIRAIEAFSGLSSIGKAGAQYKMDDAYFSRIHAMDYTLEHDDSKSLETTHQADILIFGVSRTSKTPTSIYLANQGYKVANIPIIKEPIVPKNLDISKLNNNAKPFVVGLTIDPKRLSSVREYRSVSLQRGTRNMDYTNFQSVQEEVRIAMRFFREQHYPFIDVTYRSIEETATEIIRLYAVYEREHRIFTEQAPEQKGEQQ